MRILKSVGRLTSSQLKVIMRTGAVVGAVVGVVVVAAATGVQAQRASVNLDTEGAHAGEFRIPLNKSQILRVDQRFGDLRLGNSNIADVVPLTDRTIYVLGKAVGSTSLTILGTDRRLLAVADLMVTFDAQGVKAKLAEIVPAARVEVRAVNNSLILSGTVKDSVEMARVVSVAETFAPGNVRNLLKLGGSQQVLLEVRIAEMSRAAAKQIGINLDIFKGDFNISTIKIDQAFPDQGPGLVPGQRGNVGRAHGPDGFFTAVAGLSPGSAIVDIVLEALEDKSLLKKLAEPNLIALSGESARFLAGGEFPVPRVTGDGDVEITFKEFGVGLAFTPTVLEDGLINLVVAPEVSEIDVTTQAFNVPGVSTRKAETTVELRDGQSFAIAGLLQNDFNDAIRQVPFLGDIPVLGALFRSTRFQRDETELVIVVTPRLVDPVEADQIALPTDNFAPPSDLNLFLFGNLEGPRRADAEGGGGHQVNSSDTEGAVEQLLSGQPAAGLDGPYGHILQ